MSTLYVNVWRRGARAFFFYVSIVSNTRYPQFLLISPWYDLRLVASNGFKFLYDHVMSSSSPQCHRFWCWGSCCSLRGWLSVLKIHEYYANEWLCLIAFNTCVFYKHTYVLVYFTRDCSSMCKSFILNVRLCSYIWYHKFIKILGSRPHLHHKRSGDTDK